MSQKIDIRIMHLNRWYVPKSFSMDKLEEPVVLGCFDALHVRKLQIDSEQQHPFTAGYEKLIDWKNKEKEELVDYSSQEQMLFLNICDREDEDGICFAQETVDEFWEDKTCPYIFLSMIHINHSGKLNSALTKIKKVFKEDYLSYISFDYCDIILFAHNMQIGEFLIKIKKLFEAEQGEEIVIFDTFSMVSFWPHFVQNQEHSGCLCQNEGASEFQATINISIRDYEKFPAWYSEIEEFNHDITRYNMFGRHDMSIVNEHADTVWLMQIMRKLHEEKSREVFWTFETYIKILDTDKIIMTSNEPEYLSSVYNNVKNNLNKEIKKLEKVIKNAGFRDENRYLLPIYEVRDCICSIVKNNFAEEFVYCIYESFSHFVTYMENEIKCLNDKEKGRMFGEDEIANGYDKYFTALNTLVNSTMHSERQFVQATAFNAVFYSVPPKIMAFYNAYIYRIKQILRDAECMEQYTFLIYPSFSPTISVEQISLDDAPPSDRILTVRISEKSLYDIESVLYQMVHEQAHYVGHELRCRTVRKARIMEALLKHIVSKCRMSDETYQVLSHFVNMNMISDAGDDEESKLYNCNYLEYIHLEGKRLLQMLENAQICKGFFMEYYQQKVNTDVHFRDGLLKDFGIEEKDQRTYVMELLPQYSDIKYEIFYEQLKHLSTCEEIEEYESYIDLLRSVYSECYADLQMVLVLAMEAEDYLSTFFIKQKISVEEMLLQPEFMLRISTIYRVMTDSTIWKKGVRCNKGDFKTIIGFVEEYNNDVKEGTNTERYIESKQIICQIMKLIERYDFGDGIKLKKTFTEDSEWTEIRQDGIVPFVDAAVGLYEYLLEVMKNSLEEYTSIDKQAKIREVREIVRKVLAFENATQVFDCIEEELNSYKDKGCRI